MSNMSSLSKLTCFLVKDNYFSPETVFPDKKFSGGVFYPNSSETGASFNITKVNFTAQRCQKYAWYKKKLEIKVV